MRAALTVSCSHMEHNWHTGATGWEMKVMVRMGHQAPHPAQERPICKTETTSSTSIPVPSRDTKNHCQCQNTAQVHPWGTLRKLPGSSLLVGGLLLREGFQRGEINSLTERFGAGQGECSLLKYLMKAKENKKFLPHHTYSVNSGRYVGGG